MAITKLTKHDNHNVTAKLNIPTHKHYAELRCVECDKHIQWLNRQQIKQLIQIGIKIKKPSIEEYI